MSKPSSEKEELIEKIARYIVERGLSDTAELMIKPFLPVANISGVMFGISLYPFAPLLGDTFQNYAGLIAFNTRENMRRILKRVRELEEEKKKAKENL